MLENTLERTSDKLSKSLIHDMCEILRKFNDKYISNKFKETVHLQIDDWKNRNLIVMLKDEDYVNAYLKLKFLNDEFKKENVVHKAKVYNHYKKVNRFKLTKTIQYHKNPHYDYDELIGRTVAFCVNPLSCNCAYLKIYDEQEDTWKDWYTTQIVERLFYEHKFLLRTLNTVYYFEIIH